MLMSRRDMLAGGVLGAGFGAPGGEATVEASAPDDPQVAQALRQLVTEAQTTRRSALAGEIGPVGALRENMLQFLKATNKWPDLIDVGPGTWFTMYDWHVRFGQQPAVTRLPDGRYGLTFMFTTLVLRQDQSRDYMGLAYDRER
jgi:hypothetical protein